MGLGYLKIEKRNNNDIFINDLITNECCFEYINQMFSFCYFYGKV